ncbi:class A beta-lactamase-related serine hydrolase [Flagellimonas lutimaris]|uniref:Class A beta-lactamase-related serine hydrolase n=1 Tax=Flagellimonas lutimaris TaxID=475082 RepID=A0A3A1NDK8_9FLAO|nr:serine hydrolase domain-containing protein [Allomuricauda lutimaris]RIV36709.1 class A beta-lactamase-related serine hydrolase [Allomuricauda lutimaris]
MKFYKFLCISIVTLGLACAPHQSPKQEQISHFIKAAMDSVQVVPGVAIAIVDSSGILLAKGFGYSDLENNIKVSEETNFYIASSTKPFVGLLGNILHEEGLLDLDEEITQYEPFKNFENHTVFQNITIRDLLSHQSGIDNPYLSFRLAYSGRYTKTEILRIIEEDTFQKDTGKTFQYTNFGYYLFSVLLEEHLGSKWQDLLDEKVFAPLKMEHATAYISKNDPTALAQPFSGTWPTSLGPTDTKKTDATMHAAGGLVMNAKDVARFMQFYLNKGILDGKQIYTEELVETSYSKMAPTGDAIGAFNAHGYGLGWLLGSVKGHDIRNHQGGYIGFKSSITLFPDKKLGVAIFTNHHELGRPLLNAVSNYVFEHYLDDSTDLEHHGDSLLTDLGHRLKKAQKTEKQNEEKWGNPDWNLSLPKESYVGTFYNKHDGRVRISYAAGEFQISSGNLSCVASPAKDRDCFLVELITTSKKTICFNLEKDMVQSIHFRDKVFVKLEGPQPMDKGLTNK